MCGTDRLHGGDIPRYFSQTLPVLQTDPHADTTTAGCLTLTDSCDGWKRSKKKGAHQSIARRTTDDGRKEEDGRGKN